MILVDRFCIQQTNMFLSIDGATKTFCLPKKAPKVWPAAGSFIRTVRTVAG